MSTQEGVELSERAHLRGWSLVNEHIIGMKL